tara:strand:+ start:592 stop:984 length:393 start_codon:yes stop_codon:yes gene_type:complete
MGRYFEGDIAGKFWFAVQSSNAPARFGGVEHEPMYINYWFDEEHLPLVKAELKRIEEILGEDLKRLQDFFDANNGYNNQKIIDWYMEKYKETINDEYVKDVLVDYADYELGGRIRDCIEDIGQCNINCEL